MLLSIISEGNCCIGDKIVCTYYYTQRSLAKNANNYNVLAYDTCPPSIFIK